MRALLLYVLYVGLLLIAGACKAPPTQDNSEKQPAPNFSPTKDSNTISPPSPQKKDKNIISRPSDEEIDTNTIASRSPQEIVQALRAKIIAHNIDHQDPQIIIIKSADGLEIRFSGDVYYEKTLPLVADLSEARFEDLLDGQKFNTIKLDVNLAEKMLKNLFKSGTTVTTPAQKPDTHKAAAEKLIEELKNAPAPRKLKKVNASWIPNQTNLDDFAQADKAKLRVVQSIPLKPMTSAWAFYDKMGPGGAFANTYESKADIEYKGAKSRFAELLFQAEKVSRFGKALHKNNFSQALADLVTLKKIHSWTKFVPAVRGLLENFNPTAWDAARADVMSGVQAARFRAEPDLFLALVATPKNSVIVENAGSNDDQWGNGKSGQGKNILGLLYMTHRERFLSAFKSAMAQKFDANDPEHVSFMISWLKTYDGSSKF